MTCGSDTGGIYRQGRLEHAQAVKSRDTEAVLVQGSKACFKWGA